MVSRARSTAQRLSWRLRKLLSLERELWGQGYTRIAGIDEAGAGPLAGPVVAAAVIFEPEVGLKGVDDSKRLLPERREAIGALVRQRALCWSVGRVEPEEIDRINIYRACLEAMRRAAEGLATRPDYVLVDARTVPGIDLPQRGLVGGDGICHAIAAASIVAKTARDAMMVEYDALYPGYGFAEHKGYATAGHKEAIRRLGPSPIHRRSFDPCRPTLFDGLNDADVVLHGPMHDPA